MRDIIIVALTLAAVPFAFRRPFFGLMVFSWLAYMRPQNLCWGFARGTRLSFYLGLTMVFGWVFFEFGRRPFFRRCPLAWLLLGCLACVALSLTKCYELDRNVWRYFIEFAKVIAVALFTLGQVTTRQRLRAMLWVIALSLGFYGVKAGLWGALTGGVIKQGPGGMLEDNNDFALAMVMNLPVLFYLGRTEKSLLIRRFCNACFFFSCVTVLLTHSRGGFLSMVVVFMALAWRSGKLFQASLLLFASGIAFLLFAPDHVVERLMLLKQGAAEGSAGARILSWTAGLRMIADNPWFGVGMRNYQIGYEVYAPDLLMATGSKEGHVAHNSYLQMWAEAGTPALLFYLALLASVFLTARKVRQIAGRRPHMEWAVAYSKIFEITMAGFMLGSFFLNRAHFDLTYHWVALAGALGYVARVEALKVPQRGPKIVRPAAEQTARASAGFRRTAPNGLPRWSRTP